MVVKTWMFILGLILLVVSAVAVAINFGYDFSVLSALPTNPVIYLIIDGIIGLILIFISTQRMY